MGDDSVDAPDAAIRDRPETEASYGIPADQVGLLPWTVVDETMAGERYFWVATIRPDGRPHTRPTWGVWVDATFHCGGGEGTRWVRNLAADPRVTVHTESAESVVIIEGLAVRLDEETTSPAVLSRLDDAYESKYGIRHGTPMFAVQPGVVHAWTDFPHDTTRWRFRE